MLPLTPLAPAVRISALNTVLTYTKAEHGVESDVCINSVEACPCLLTQTLLMRKPGESAAS